MNRIRAAAAGVSVFLGMLGVASAQTLPFQSTQRGRIGAGLGQVELPKGGVFEPRVEAAVQYVENIEFAEDGEPQINTAGLEVAPGFYGSYSSGTAIGAIDYSLIGRVWDESDFDDVSHRLSANGQWFAVPEWFSLRGQAGYEDAVIDPRNGLNYGGIGIFGQDNLQEIATAGLSPILQRRAGAFELVAQYTYARTWFLDEGEGQPVVGVVTNEDSTDQSAGLSFGTAEADSQISARVFYDWERSEYETALPFEYERAGLDAAVRLSRSLALVGDVGKESDLDVSTTQGGLDADFWSAGLRWDPNERTTAEARYGEQFFGSSYMFTATHRARFLEFSATYTERPTVETRQLSLGDFDPGQLPPASPGNFGRFTSSPFVATDARVGITATGSRTRVDLVGFRFERDYLNELRSDENGTGVSLDSTRQLATNLSTDFSISYSEYEGAESLLNPGPSGVSSDYDTQVIVRLNRASRAHLTLGAEAGYFIRSGAGDFDGWWVALRARWEP